MMILSRVRENELFEAIRSVGLEPADCEWSKRKGGGHYDATEYRRLTHKPTQAYLECGLASDGH